MTSLTLIVLTYNEEVNLPHCLESVSSLVEGVFVVDSGSEDATPAIARAHGARVVEHPFENQAQQFNWALDNLPIETEWVLRLDADEYLLPDLRREISDTLPRLPQSVAGLYMRRRTVFQGRWIRHGGYYPTWLLRLFRTGMGRCEMREMDEHIVVTGGETRRLENDFVDHNRKGLSFWTRKHDDYAGREARVLVRAERDDGSVGAGVEGRLDGTPPERNRWLKRNVYARLPPFLRAFLYFIHRYVVRLGFLDGKEGLIFHVLQGFWYRFYVDARLHEMKHGAEDEDPGTLDPVSRRDSA
jgi:glycosyltransferase involved in cell wall biosynthesis